MAIDKDKLKELASAPKATTPSIYEGLGFKNSATFYYQLNQDPEAKQIFESRPGARAKPKKSARATGESSNRQSATGNRKSSTPPPQAKCQSRSQGTLQQASTGV